VRKCAPEPTAASQAQLRPQLALQHTHIRQRLAHQPALPSIRGGCHNQPSGAACRSHSDRVRLEKQHAQRRRRRCGCHSGGGTAEVVGSGAAYHASTYHNHCALSTSTCANHRRRARPDFVSLAGAVSPGGVPCASRSWSWRCVFLPPPRPAPAAGRPAYTHRPDEF
jgi:hypothetical protein